MKMISYGELQEKFHAHNKKHNVTHQYGCKKPIYGVIVFTCSTFKKHYPEKSRSYVVRCDEKMYVPGLGGNSIFGTCLDGTDPCIRLDYAMHDGWKIDFCYIRKTFPKIKRKHETIG